MSKKNIFLQANKRVDCALECRFGENLGGLLEAGA